MDADERGLPTIVRHQQLFSHMEQDLPRRQGTGDWKQASCKPSSVVCPLSPVPCPLFIHLPLNRALGDFPDRFQMLQVLLGTQQALAVGGEFE